MRILIIEDDESTVHHLNSILASQNHRVDIATDSETGWTLSQTHDYNLILVAVQMAELNGLRLCHRIRELGLSPPIVALIQEEQAEIVHQVLAAGANDVLQKPIDQPELVISLIQQLEQSQLASPTSSEHLDLHQTKDELERRVAERTAELVSVNQKLQAELDEHRNTQLALRVSQARLAGIVEIADDAIISINRDYQITLFNRGAEKIFGYLADEVIGQPLDLLMPKRFIDVHRQHVKEFGQKSVTTQQMHNRREIWGQRKDGTEFPAEASISKLNLEGEVIYTVYLRDITERKQIDRMKDEFVSMVSHELRTPLTSIHGSLGMLTSGLLKADSEPGKRLLHIAVESTDRLVRLINDILDIERIESGHVKMEKVGCDLVDLIQEAVDVMRPIAEKANITLSVSAETVWVDVDRDRIIQTLTNLLSNALKFSPSPSTVSVATEIDANQVLVIVKDQGRGIPADKINSIFERFQQVDSSDSRNQDGTGLGLAICRSIVYQHQGRIWVESTVNVGSTFYFTLPLSPSQPQPTTASQTVDIDLTPSELTETAPLVLVCNDSAAARSTLEHLLERQGYRVVSVASGEDAIAQANSNRPDVILLLGSHAWETMVFLKQQSITSEIPMLICRVSLPNGEGVDTTVAPIDETALFELLREALSPASRRMRVLIVEDNPELAEMLTILFERHGVSVIRASTGREAIRMSQQLHPDLLVLDLVLPEGDGFTVVEWLKLHSQLYRTPLIVYSVKELDRRERDRLKLGPTEFLTKGRVTIQEFEQRVMALLQQITQTITVE
jgi:PAS domain S-box-containing protein